MNGVSQDNLQQEVKTNERLYKMEAKDYVFSIFAVLSTIVFVILSLWGNFKIGFTGSYILFFSVLTAYLFNKEKPISLFGGVCGSLSLIASLVYGYSTSGNVNFFLFIVMFFLGAIWFLSLTDKFNETGELSIIPLVFSSVFKNAFGSIDRAIGGLFFNKNKKTKTFGKAIIGVLVAIPILLIILPLLSSADMAFEGLLDRIGNNLALRFFQIIVGIIFAPFVITYGCALRKEPKKEEIKKEQKTIDNVFVISFLGAISVVYLAYLFSQLAYFFNAFKGILPKEFIPSEYARRGFFEMSIIAGINFVIVFVSLLLSRKNENKPSKLVCALCVFVSLFTLVLISTAFAKMALYIENFGLTVLRITTSGFMLFLFIVFLALVFRCFFNKVKIFRIALITATVVLVALGFMNVEPFVANYNVQAYQQQKLKSIDIDMIGSLGLEGVPALYDIYTNVNNVRYKKEAYEELERINKYQNRNEKREAGDWNLTEYKARKILNEMFNEKTAK